jgi:hypothetical protein
MWSPLVLLKNDATVNQATKDGITPLHIAVQKNLKDIEELLKLNYFVYREAKDQMVISMLEFLIHITYMPSLTASILRI